MTFPFTPPEILPLIGAAFLFGIHMEAGWKVLNGWTVGAAIVSAGLEWGIAWVKVGCFREAALLAIRVVDRFDPLEH